MLSAGRSLALAWEAGPEMPRIPALVGLYQHGTVFRQGQFVMIAGRPGAMKSALAMWICDQWNLPTLYCSADMSSFTFSTRLAGSRLGMTTEQVEEAMRAGGEKADMINRSLAKSNIQLGPDSPITWYGLDEEIKSYIELHGYYPRVIVVDNLMDIEDCETDFSAQQAAMQELVALCRNTGSTVIVLHHAQENSQTVVEMPPSRGEVHNKLSQKPELILTVAINPHNHQLKIATVKQRSGPSDPSAQSYTTMIAYPETTRFGPYVPGRSILLGGEAA